MAELIEREQVYVFLHLFFSYGKKLYQLKSHFGIVAPTAASG